MGCGCRKRNQEEPVVPTPQYVNTRVLTYIFFFLALSLSCLRWYIAAPTKYSGIPATTSSRKPPNIYTSSIFIQNK